MTIEEIRNKALNKRVNIRGNEDKIIAVDDDLLFKMKSGKMFYKKAFIKDVITTKDKELQSVIDFFKSEESETVKEEPKEKEPEETIQQSQEKARQEAIARAEKDFEEDNRDLYNLCKLALKKGKFDKVPSVFGDIFADAYVTRFRELDSKTINKRLKKVSGIIEETYPGDVEELIKFLRKAITSITVVSGDDTYKSVSSTVDELNQRDKTNYTLADPIQGQKAAGWTAHITTDKKVLKDMPKEMHEWRVDKNTGYDPNEFVQALVYDEKTAKLTSNPIVLDLLLEYDFNLGENKNAKKKEESLPEAKGKKLRPTIYNILGWLSRDKQTYRTFIDHFKDLEDVKIKDIIDWIKNDDKLYIGYKDFFEEE